MKLCYFTFFAENEGIKAKEAPFNMMTCRGILWLCTVPLKGILVRAQAFSSREVTSVTRLSRNPISFPEIAKQYVYRGPMGLVGILLAFIFLFFYGLIYFLAS